MQLAETSNVFKDSLKHTLTFTKTTAAAMSTYPCKGPMATTLGILCLGQLLERFVPFGLGLSHLFMPILHGR
jgi:hypothetical protein